MCSTQSRGQGTQMAGLVQFNETLIHGAESWRRQSSLLGPRDRRRKVNPGVADSLKKSYIQDILNVLHSLLPACLPAKLLQSCPTLCDPRDGFPSLGFSRQEHWSGLPFPSPMHESEKWKWSGSVVSDSRDPMDCSLPGSSVHGIF